MFNFKSRIIGGAAARAELIVIVALAFLFTYVSDWLAGAFGGMAMTIIIVCLLVFTAALVAYVVYSFKAKGIKPPNLAEIRKMKADLKAEQENVGKAENDNSAYVPGPKNDAKE